MQQVRLEETALDLHGREYDKSYVLVVSPETRLVLVVPVRIHVRIWEGEGGAGEGGRGTSDRCGVLDVA